MSIKQVVTDLINKVKSAVGIAVAAPSVQTAVAALHTAVADLEVVASHHTGLSAAADKLIAEAAAAKLAAEQEIASAQRVATNLKNLLGL
jgi:ribosomal protein L12E/L44/L45/RPP1/RPP2